jgi:hypothetical protein
VAAGYAGVREPEPPEQRGLRAPARSGAPGHGGAHPAGREIGGYEAADHAGDRIQAVYHGIAGLLGTRPDNVAIVANGTAGFIQALTSFDLERGDVIVTSRSDYTSNQIQYMALARRLGVRIVHAADHPGGGIDPGSVREALRSMPVRLVAVSWIPTHSGLVQDVEGVGEVCEEFGVPSIVDAVQAVGQIPIDVSVLKCDYLVATARKFLRGPRGIAFVYASDPGAGPRRLSALRGHARRPLDGAGRLPGGTHRETVRGLGVPVRPSSSGWGRGGLRPAARRTPLRGAGLRPGGGCGRGWRRRTGYRSSIAEATGARS